MKAFLSTVFYSLAAKKYKEKRYKCAKIMNYFSCNLYSTCRNYSMEGLIELKLNNIQKCIELQNKSLQLYENIDAYKGLILAYLEKKDYKKVIDYTKKALTLNPQQNELKVNLITANFALNRYEQVEQIALKEIDYLSGDSKILVLKYLLEIHLQNKDFNKLRFYIDELNKNVANSIVANVYLCEYYVLIGELEQAKRVFVLLKGRINDEKLLDLEKKIESLSKESFS